MTTSRRYVPVNASCSSQKRPYPTKKSAQAALRAIRRDTSRARQVRPTSTYRCPECGLWHLTHQHTNSGPGSNTARPRSDMLTQKQVEEDLEDLYTGRFERLPNIKF